MKGKLKSIFTHTLGHIGNRYALGLAVVIVGLLLAGFIWLVMPLVAFGILVCLELAFKVDIGITYSMCFWIGWGLMILGVLTKGGD